VTLQIFWGVNVDGYAVRSVGSDPGE
jgi:hypothetical protein